VKGEYSYDSWSNLVSKKDKTAKAKAKADPNASIMNMMKDMYDDGDDNMKKIIGEAMMKSRQVSRSFCEWGWDGDGWARALELTLPCTRRFLCLAFSRVYRAKWMTARAWAWTTCEAGRAAERRL